MQLAEQHAGANTAAVALPASLIAHIRYEQGRLDEAEAMVIDRSPIIDATGMLECALSAYLVLVRIAAHRRNIERAYALLEQLENLGHVRKWGSDGRSGSGD
jgi:LuxR family transcriptional regulator, maltose regulon positive regulatory protein